MLENAVYLVLGFLVGFLLGIIIRWGGRAELELKNLALEERNKVLWEEIEKGIEAKAAEKPGAHREHETPPPGLIEENPETAYAQDRESEGEETRDGGAPEYIPADRKPGGRK